MLIERQIAERRERAASTVVQILARPETGMFGDYRVKSASGKTYRVAMRGPGLFENYCSCPDFAVNTLGTCKHIEALLLRLRQPPRQGAGANETWADARLHLAAIRRNDRGAVASAGVTLAGFAGPGRRSISIPRACCAASTFGISHKSWTRFGKADDQAVVYSDVLEYLDRENELAEGLDLERQLLATVAPRAAIRWPASSKRSSCPTRRRAPFSPLAGGAWSWPTTWASARPFRPWPPPNCCGAGEGIERVLVVAPASVKYQWKTEIEKFSDLPAQVIDGLLPRRRALYASPAFFNLTSYELVLKDMRYMHELQPDLIILDEAQRIRNWTTATARTIKQLKSRYAFVLTGTPLENKLEELFSVVEFIDGRRLGPAFRFLARASHGGRGGPPCSATAASTAFTSNWRPSCCGALARRFSRIFPSAPTRFSASQLTQQQAEPYWEQNDILAALMRKWERQGWLSEIDQIRVLCCIQNMRMLCNSTFLFDKQTNHSPKLEEFREIVRELAIEENRKVVVFSEYERMTWLAGEELEKLGIGFVSLHGGVPSRNRGALMEKFRDDPECKVFLSTDAGGVGLNLQAASAVINFEPPWNPARLEQRIGRVHRLGQAHPVQVIHLLTNGSIEERVWDTLQLKKSLFAGVFDSPTGEVSFAALGKKNVLQAVKEIFADQPGRPKPVIDQPPPTPVLAKEVTAVGPGSAQPPHRPRAPALCRPRTRLAQLHPQPPAPSDGWRASMEPRPAS